MIPALDAVAQSPDNDERVGQKWAVLIGVNDYGEMKDLTQCRNDVQQFPLRYLNGRISVRSELVGLEKCASEAGVAELRRRGVPSCR